MSEDVEDYLKHKLLSEQGISLGRMKIKDGVLPHVFTCQQKPQVGERPNIYKRKKAVDDAMVAASADVHVQHHDYGRLLATK